MKSTGKTYSWITRLLCLLLAGYFLNFSIDARDANPDSVPEDLAKNDIESLAELVAEEVMDIPNAFAEHDERDAEEGGSLDFSKEFFSVANVLQMKPQLNAPVPRKFIIPAADFFPSLSSEVTTPPPRG